MIYICSCIGWWGCLVFVSYGRNTTLVNTTFFPYHTIGWTCVCVCVCVCMCVHEICWQSLREALETGFTNLTTLKMSQNPIGDNGMLQVRCTINTVIHTLFLFLWGSLSGSLSICMNIYPVPSFFLAFLLALSLSISLSRVLSIAFAQCMQKDRSLGGSRGAPLL